MIRIENLSYSYKSGIMGKNTALHDINLEIPTGSLTALIGHTGSGKSTLTKHLNALLRPDTGKIYIDGADITDKRADLKAIRRKVGMVFQYPEHQLFEETVYSDIAFGVKNMGCDNDETKARVRRAADIMGISNEELEKSPFELSGGQKRRAAIAGVLAMEPDILVMDEPAAGLDPDGRDKMLLLIKRLHDEHKQMTIIFVSHSMEDAAETAEDIIVMNNGTVAMHDTVSGVFSRAEELLDMGLDIPQITALMKRLSGDSKAYTAEAAAKEIAEMIGYAQ